MKSIKSTKSIKSKYHDINIVFIHSQFIMGKYPLDGGCTSAFLQFLFFPAVGGISKSRFKFSSIETLSGIGSKSCRVVGFI